MEYLPHLIEHSGIFVFDNSKEIINMAFQNILLAILNSIFISFIFNRSFSTNYDRDMEAVNCTINWIDETTKELRFRNFFFFPSEARPKAERSLGNWVGR